MKKFLSFLIIILLQVSPVKAEIFEIGKCFQLSLAWYPDITDKEYIGHSKGKTEWSEEVHFKFNTLIKIDKDEFKKKYKKNKFKWSYDEGEGDLMHKMLIEKYEKYPRMLYFYMNPRNFAPKEIKNLKKIGGQIINKYDKNLFSINTNTGTVTYLQKYTKDYFNYLSAKYLEEALGKTVKGDCFGSGMTEEECKKIYKETYERQKKQGLIRIFSYNINNFAGGLLIAKDTYDNELVIDFNEATIIENEGKPGAIHFVCPKTEFFVSNTNDNPSGSSGTAFFINNRGFLLTNNHVVEGCKTQKISYRNKNHVAKIIATDKTLDLALLKTKIKPKSYIEFTADEPKKLNEIFVAGYPLGKGLSDDLKISSGIISSLKGFEDNSNEIQIDAPINPGNSGGPIINKKGLLVGIAVSGLAKDQTEGINFGIKSSAAESFLKSNKIKPIKSSNLNARSNDDLLNILEEGTVYTYCE